MPQYFAACQRFSHRENSLVLLVCQKEKLSHLSADLDLTQSSGKHTGTSRRPFLNARKCMFVLRRLIRNACTQPVCNSRRFMSATPCAVLDTATQVFLQRKIEINTGSLRYVDATHAFQF